MCCCPVLQAAAEDASHSRKDLHSSVPAFKALIEMGGASAQVTFMPDAHWHKHSTGSSKQRVRLRLPGRWQKVTRECSVSCLGFVLDLDSGD